MLLPSALFVSACGDSTSTADASADATFTHDSSAIVDAPLNGLIDGTGLPTVDSSVDGTNVIGTIDASSVVDARMAMDATASNVDLANTNLPDASGPARGPAPVLLGAAGNYVILAKSEVTTVPASAITGDVGLSPAAASFITGFSMTRVGTYWTSPQVTGKVYAADNDSPTPSNLTTAITNMMTAYTDAAGRPTPDFLNLGAGAIGGLVLVPGLYKWTSTLSIPSNVTLSGGPNDTWIFQTSGDLSLANAAKVNLVGGAKASNVFWQVAGAASLGTTSHFEGILLSKTGINLHTGGSVTGRLLAQSAVTLQTNAVTQPAP